MIDWSNLTLPGRIYITRPKDFSRGTLATPAVDCDASVTEEGTNEMTRPANSKNPVHDPKHPHYLPDVADAIDPKTKKLKPEVFAPNVAKAMKLWEAGDLEFSDLSETVIDSTTDRVSFNRKHTGK